MQGWCCSFAVYGGQAAITMPVLGSARMSGAEGAQVYQLVRRRQNGHHAGTTDSRPTPSRRHVASHDRSRRVGHLGGMRLDLTNLGVRRHFRCPLQQRSGLRQVIRRAHGPRRPPPPARVRLDRRDVDPSLARSRLLRSARRASPPWLELFLHSDSAFSRRPRADRQGALQAMGGHQGADVRLR